VNIGAAKAHRVVGSTRARAGYGAGLDRTRALLVLEGAIIRL
jgi:O6-methylguanine-DNA--protein-cysteine methyltransferase